MKSIWIALGLVIWAWWGCAEDGQPKNLVLIIGDGMGFSSIDTVSLILHGPSGRLVMEDMPITGMMKTYPHGGLIPDSASTASAMATGYRTRSGVVAKDTDGVQRRTLMRAMLDAGKRGGVITTSYLVDATPAAFTAHADQREQFALIARQMFEMGLDLYVGGEFKPENGDWTTLVQRMQDRDGYVLIRDVRAFPPKPVAKTIGIFPKRERYDGSGPTLDHSTGYVLDLLNREDGSGFFLLVESEDTDNSSHDQDLAYLTAAIEELDAAVDVALRFARRTGDTLLIVTSDHVTGGVGVVEGRSVTDGLKVAWHSRGHTAQWVPIFAFGPGSQRFSGVHDNTEIPAILADLFQLPNFPETP